MASIFFWIPNRIELLIQVLLALSPRYLVTVVGQALVVLRFNCGYRSDLFR